MGERGVRNAEAEGSNPLPSITLSGVDHLLQFTSTFFDVFLHIVEDFHHLFVTVADLFPKVILQIVELSDGFLRESPNILARLGTGLGRK